jgi:hypothetical protein
LPWRIHCQIWAREISAVAASSIRLLMPAAPRPPSQNEMYWKPTLTLLRRPSSVISPGVAAASRICSGVTWTSSRRRSIWFGLEPRTLSNSSRAASTTSGWATQVPSKPASASRFLSSRTAAIARSFASGSLREGISADMPPIANAPRAWQVLTSSSV